MPTRTQTTWLERFASRVAALPYFRGRDRISQALFTRASRLGRIVVTVDDIDLALDLADGVQQEIFLSRRLPSQVADTLTRLLAPGMTVLDVGANIGWTAVKLGRRVGSTGAVYAFEPGSRTFSSLTRNIELNEMPWVMPTKAACGERASIATLYEAREASDYSSLEPCIRDLTHHTESCEVVRLDTWLDEAGVSSIDLAKIDVEGAEWDVLKGLDSWLRRSERPLFVLEVSAENMSRFGYRPREMLDWLAGFGYKTFIADAKHLKPYALGAARSEPPAIDVVCLPEDRIDEVEASFAGGH
jgi:FkbM family methyltransferase